MIYNTENCDECKQQEATHHAECELIMHGRRKTVHQFLCKKCAKPKEGKP